jgi:hypothetical protein
MRKIHIITLTCLFLCFHGLAGTEDWYTADIDNDNGHHTFENSVVRYDYYVVPGASECFTGNCQFCTSEGCGECPYDRPMGNGIGNFIIKSVDEDVCPFWNTAGTGYNLCDYSKPVISDFTEYDKYIEYKVVQNNQQKWERFYKDLPILEVEYISVNCLWLDDGLWVQGERPTLVSYGMDDIEGMTAGKALWEQSEDICEAKGDEHHNFGNCFVEANGSNPGDVLYNGHLIFGFINKANGHGSGFVIPYNNLRDIKFFWDSDDLVNVEYWDGLMRAQGSKRYYFAVTGGRDEIMEVGRAIVDEGGIPESPAFARKLLYNNDKTVLNIEFNQKNHLIFNYSLTGDYQISAVRADGSIEYIKNLHNIHTYTVPTHSFSPGIYITYIKAANASQVKKIIIGN